MGRNFRWSMGLTLVALLGIVGGSCFRPGATPDSDAALRTLGTLLLAERRLSATGERSCLSCHRPERGYSDGLAVARPGGLNTPTLWGLAERERFGWFSPELTSLEAFLTRPLDDPNEMGPRRPATLARLRADPQLRAAYGRAFPDAAELVTWEQSVVAMAAAIRAIAAPPTAHERFLAGDPTALPPAAIRGQRLFVELGCASCHQGTQFASDSYHNLGVAATNDERARVPSLRGVSLTAPYFHNGSAATLAEVVRFYARAERTGDPGVSRAITPLQLTEQEILELVAFLESL